MITAIEALQLPTATLTEEDLQAANKLEAEIEEHIRTKMEFRGVEIEGRESRPNVLSAVNHRLVTAGYNAQWQLIATEHPLNKAIRQIVGFKLTLSPNADAYKAAFVS